jgi:hypothetical protein
MAPPSRTGVRSHKLFPVLSPTSGINRGWWHAVIDRTATAYFATIERVHASVAYFQLCNEETGRADRHDGGFRVSIRSSLLDRPAAARRRARRLDLGVTRIRPHSSKHRA